MRNLGIVLAVIGTIMIAFTGFNFVTKEKVVDIGPLEINKEKNNPISWSPILGGVILIGGIALIATSKK